MNPPGTEAFWSFSLECYNRPGVAELSLALQDRHGRDVNLLLLAIYAGQVLGRRLSAEDFAALDAAVAPWRDQVILPLRAARRGLKDWAEEPAAALRRSVQAAELEAERLAQRLLLAALPKVPAEDPGPALARANLTTYAGEQAATLASLV